MKTLANRQTLLCAALVLLFGAVYVFVHHKASYTFPVPWPDESGFLWQSIAVQENNSLLIPQMNPERHLLRIPPGYMIVTGIVFKVFGFSFSLARTLSLLCILASFLLLAMIVGRYDTPVVSLILCGLFLLSRDFVIAGNVARMEALTLLLLCGGFLLFQLEKDYKALALMALTPLIHPGGLFFLSAAGLYFLLGARFRKVRWCRSDLGLLAGVALLWLAYGLYIGWHWEAFKHDMAWNFGKGHQKTPWQTLVALFKPRNFRILLLVALSGAYGLKERLPSTLLLMLAFPGWLLNKVRSDMWYSVFETLFFLLLAVFLIHVAVDLVGGASGRRARWRRVSTIVVTVLVLLLGYYKDQRIEDPRTYPGGMTWWDMRLPAQVPYLSEADVKQVRSFLEELADSKLVLNVQVFPRADTLFFYQAGDPRIRFWQPLFYRPKVDVYIVHASRYLPKKIQATLKQELKDTGIDPAQPSRILFRRDDSEVWYYRVVGESAP